jgi:small subunit ribosomal protein S2
MQKAKNSSTAPDSVVEDMFKAGAHYGYSKTRRHPSVSPYIYATKNKSDIINLEKTGTQLEEAKKYAAELGAKGKVLLFVGTKPEAKSAVKAAAESLGMPYVTERWIGGTLSNFSEIKKRISELENYQKESTTGGLEKYTKKERVVMAKKMEKLARYYTGLLGLKKIPDALFVIDARAENIAATEANKSGVPVIALVNSDTNIKKVEYPIVANDAGIPSIKFFAAAVADAYKEGLPAQAGGHSVAQKTS